MGRWSSEILRTAVVECSPAVCGPPPGASVVALEAIDLKYPGSPVTLGVVAIIMPRVWVAVA
jgi:hypothetical protein